MTLLSIVQGAANAIPVPAPQTVIGNTDPTATLLLQMAQDEGEELARKPPGGWVTQQIEHLVTIVSLDPIDGTTTKGSATITGLSSTASITAYRFAASGTGIPLNAVVVSKTSTTVTLDQACTASGTVDVTFSQYAYPVPSDFRRPIDNTLWDRSRFWKMVGPLSPQQWQMFKSSIFTIATIQRLTRFEYINGTLCLLILPIPTDNGDTLVYEYVSNAWCTSSTGTPQTSWKADTDVALLDEFLMRKGVLWRALERMGMAYEDKRDEYYREVDKAMAHDGGAQNLSLSPQTYGPLIGPWSVIEGNWPSGT